MLVREIMTVPAYSLPMGSSLEMAIQLLARAKLIEPESDAGNATRRGVGWKRLALTAAGIAGLLKGMLVLQHGQIPPSLHFKTPSPHIDFEKLKLRVPTELEPFPGIAG